MKKSKHKPRQISAAILAAQERNRIAQELKEKQAYRRDLGQRLLMWLSPFLMATHFGARGGGHANGTPDFFPPLSFTPTQSKYILKNSEKVIQSLNKAIVATEIDNQANYKVNRQVNWTTEILPTINSNCVTFLPEWCGVDENNIMVNLIVSYLLDWKRLQDHDDFTIPDDIDAFVYDATTFADHLINDNNMRLRKTLTVLYWVNWIRVFTKEKYESEHPNSWLGLTIPILGEGSAIEVHSGKEYKEAWALYFENKAGEKLEIPFVDLQKINIERMNKETKKLDAIMKEKFPNCTLKMCAGRKYDTSQNMFALPSHICNGDNTKKVLFFEMLRGASPVTTEKNLHKNLSNLWQNF